MVVTEVRVVASSFRATANIGLLYTLNTSVTSLLRMARMVMVRALQVPMLRILSSLYHWALLQSRYSDEETGETYTEVVGEVTEHGEQLVLLKGGRGGLGNWHFRTATNQTPRYAQPGEEGSEGAFILELKVLADVGLVGFPNAGKSTLLSVVSAAKPKIANYAFTTLEPNLGIVSVRDDHSFVMADIPGIIEGAHEGRGLGTRFLRHIERNSVLLFMIPADSDDIAADYEILLGELTQYNPELLDKERLLAITKCDMLDDELIEQMKAHLPEGIETIFISSVANMNITQLKDMLWRALTK